MTSLLEVLLGDVDDGHASDDRTPPVDLYVDRGGGGDAGRAAARADRDAPLRRDGLARRSSAPGHRVIAYDARGHGRSDPAPAPDAYRYEDLARRPRRRARRARDRPRGARGRVDGRAHRCCASRSSSPSASPALVVITPAYDAEEYGDADALARWDALADGPARRGGVEGFVEAYGDPGVPEAWRDTVLRVDAPAPGRPRAPRGGRRRAARGAALAAVRRRSTTLARDRGADGRRGRPRRGRPRPPARRRRGVRARDPGRRAASSRRRASRRSPGRAASCRRSSPRSPGRAEL